MSSTPADTLPLSISSEISIANSNLVSLSLDDLEMIDNDYKEEEDFVSDKYAHHPFPDKVALHIDDIDKTFMTSVKQQIEILSNHVESVKT